MDYDLIIKSFIDEKSDFSTGEFSDMLRASNPNIGRSTIYHLLKSLCDSGEIGRMSKGHFSATGTKNYSYELSATGAEVARLISKTYPLVTFQIWELRQMNEFVNHLLVRNTIFVDVEDMLDESIFNLLFEEYAHVLHTPTADEYYRYSGNETIAVQRLISEAPAPYGGLQQTSLEKILVDLFGRGISGSIVSRSEYPAIYEGAFKKYNINQAKMFRYARRRGLESTIRDFVSEKTGIELEVTE